MATLHRVKIEWTGFAGGPGVSQLYVSDALPAVTALKTWASAWAYLLPSVVRLTIPNSGDTVDTATGEINGSWGGGSTQTVQGTGSSGAYFAAGGASVRWFTDTVVRGRRITGRTYLVPLTSLAYDGSTLVDTAVTAIQSASTALIADPGFSMHVVRRPSSQGAANGTAGLITGSAVPDKQAVLRSRRD